MLIFSNNTKPRKGFLPKGQSRKLVVPTYHLHRNTRNRGNFVGKSNGSRHSVWEALEVMGCVCGNVIVFLLCFSLFS